MSFELKVIISKRYLALLFSVQHLREVLKSAGKHHETCYFAIVVAFCNYLCYIVKVENGK